MSNAITANLLPHRRARGGGEGGSKKDLKWASSGGLRMQDLSVPHVLNAPIRTPHPFVTHIPAMSVTHPLHLPHPATH